MTALHISRSVILLMACMSLVATLTSAYINNKSNNNNNNNNNNSNNNNNNSNLPFRYFTNQELFHHIKRLSRQHPHISRTYVIGKSVRNVPLLVIEISDNPGVAEPLEPNVKFIGNIHGNEVVGRNVLLRFAEHLLLSYGRNHTLTKLVNETRIHILCTMNPDGYARGNVRWGRYNANFVDLNRNFDDPYEPRRVRLQPETAAVMRWMKEYPFVLSTALHGGALVANYPYDNVPANKKRMGYIADYAAAPDDDVFVHMSKAYASTHGRMAETPQCGTSSFAAGITNGAAWYTITGGMQDHNYRYTNCLELTLEISCEKFPPPQQLRGFWKENRAPLLLLLRMAHIGIKGTVVDAVSGDGLARARVDVVGRLSKAVYTWRGGGYWRLLLPGVYTVHVTAVGYVSMATVVKVMEGRVEVVDFRLQPMVPPPVMS